MTLYETALARRRKWREEAELARQEAEQAREKALKEGRAEGREEGLVEGQATARETLLRAQIAAVLDDPTLTPQEKNHFTESPHDKCLGNQVGRSAALEDNRELPCISESPTHSPLA